MGKNKNKKYSTRANSWQNASLNRRNYMMYRDWIMSLAMLRYEWVNLPESCDARYLEWTLLTQGVATISKTEVEGIKLWSSTQAATLSPPNVYDNYTSWHSFGNGGWDYPVTPETGVLVWDNMLRFPIWNQIDIMAHRLAKIARTIDANLQQQMVTKIVEVPQERYNDALQMVKQNSGGEPYIIGINGLTKDMQTNVLGMETPIILSELQLAMENIWNEVYSLLGIDHLTRKAERMIESEVNSTQMSTRLRALDGLKARRQACRELNEKFGLDVNVVWSKDMQTENFNIMGSIKELMEVSDGIS